MQEQMKSISAREMHKYVWGLVGVFIAIAVSYPIAFLRVSQHEKFAGFHVKSLTLEGKLEKASAVSVAVTPARSLENNQLATTSNQIAIGSSTNNTQSLEQAMTVNENTPGEEINQPEQIKQLNQKVYDRIAKVWRAGRHLKQAVAYRVAVTADGAIASYEPLLQPALDFVGETPLPELTKTTTKGAIGQFKVVFTRKGILEVSPWHGWKKSR